MCANYREATGKVGGKCLGSEDDRQGQAISALGGQCIEIL